MLSVPIRGDGTIDDRERQIVEEIGTWMGRYGEAIYGTRPWRLHGEGSTANGSGAFSEGGQASTYTAKDVRYVTRNGAIHALVLGWPADGKVRLALLGSGNPVGRGEVQRVTLPGSDAPLSFTRSPDVLEVRVPDARRNSIGLALVINGVGLTT